jgi:hypothetical protein
MAALPAGWIDTGIVVNHSGTFEFQVRAVAPAYGTAQIVAHIAGTELGLDTSGGFSVCGSQGTAGTVDLWRNSIGGVYASRTIIDTVTGACPQPFLTATVTVVMTGLRLGASIAYNVGSDLTTLTYGLFADGSTVHTVDVAGDTETYTYGAVTQVDAQVECTLFALYNSSFGSGTTSMADGFRIDNEIWNTEVNPTHPNFSASLFSKDAPPFSATGIIASYPPLKYEAQVRVEDAGGGTPIRDVEVGQLATSQTTIVANPGTTTETWWGWTTFAIEARLDTPWTFSGITSSFVTVPVRRLKPLTPQSAPEDFAPITYVVDASVPVLLSTNNWSGTGSIVLSGTGNSDWAVSGAGTTSRTLAGTYDVSDDYTTTKHTAGNDVWGWGLYSYLDVELTSDTVATLTMTVNYRGVPSSATTYPRTYTLNVTSGTHTYRVDLPFPNEGGPDYWERAVSIDFSGFANGNYTMAGMTLVAVEDTYLKVQAIGELGAPDQTGLVIACDGSFPAYWWGPNNIYSGTIRRKDDETGYDGTGASTNTQNGGCVRMDDTITAVATEWARMEGMTLTYDGTGIDAALTDGDGNTLTPTRYARWLHTLFGERTTPGATGTLYASIPFEVVNLVPAAAGTFVLPFILHIGMMLEALCVDASSARASSGHTMFARRNATGTPAVGDTAIGSGVTDASGFVSVPIPTGLVAGSAFYTYLTAF